MVMDMSLLEIRGLETEFQTEQGVVKALRGIDYTVDKGEVLGIVGESGSGKSVGMLSMMGLLAPNGTVTAGEMIFDGEDISPVKYKTKKEKKEYEKKMNAIRGNDISMIFQDPMTSLNPTIKIGKQIGEAVVIHNKNYTKEQVNKKVLELMELVGISHPKERYHQYPWQFSGGMRQRCVMAIALAADPDILFADEPTTALDVTIQAQILDLLREIQMKLGTATILVSHDLGVVARVADRVAVMYAGKIVESGTVEDVFYDPRHPYTWGLLSAMPDLGTDDERLYTIPGSPPNLLHKVTGDAFAPRNKYALNIDSRLEPPMFKISETHSAATWLLHPKAPKVDMPPELRDRIERMKKEGGIA